LIDPKELKEEGILKAIVKACFAAGPSGEGKKERGGERRGVGTTSTDKEKSNLKKGTRSSTFPIIRRRNKIKILFTEVWKSKKGSNLTP